jgi:predicted transcriptional regulator
MKAETWQLKARFPSSMREAVRSIAKDQDRSVNYLLVKAVSEFIARYSEAPAVAPTEASICPHPRKDKRHD